MDSLEVHIRSIIDYCNNLVLSQCLVKMHRRSFDRNCTGRNVHSKFLSRSKMSITVSSISPTYANHHIRIFDQLSSHHNATLCNGHIVHLSRPLFKILEENNEYLVSTSIYKHNLAMGSKSSFHSVLVCRRKITLKSLCSALLIKILIFGRVTHYHS